MAQFYCKILRSHFAPVEGEGNENFKENKYKAQGDRIGLGSFGANDMSPSSAVLTNLTKSRIQGFIHHILNYTEYNQ